MKAFQLDEFLKRKGKYKVETDLMELEIGTRNYT